MYFGIARHAVVAALWSVHQYAKGGSQASGHMSPEVARYIELQFHLVLSYIDSRFRLSKLDFYEQYTGTAERPIAPALTGGVGLAIRELTRNKFGVLLLQFPQNQKTPEFAQAFVATEFQTEGLGSESLSDGIRFVETLKRYFRRYIRVQQGWKPPQKRRRGSGGSGGHRRRPGFIHFSGAKGVYFAEKTPRPDDPDLPYMDMHPVYIDRDGEFDDEPGALEKSGLSPNDLLEPVFQLYTPSELNSRLAAARYQRLAIEMHGQFLPFSYSNLTATEIRRLHRECETKIAGYLASTARNIQVARRHAMASLMVKVMLYLGQSFDKARNINFAWQTKKDDDLPDLNDRKPTLLLSAAVENDWATAQVLGFWIPAISPNYRTDLDDALDEVCRETADSFLLPDHLGLGQQLLAFLRRENRPNAHIFGIDPVPAKAAVTEVIGAIADDRITIDKITRVLSAQLMQLTGDQSLVWIVTGIHRMTLSKLANHRGYNPTADILDKLCTYFGCRIEQLVEHLPDEPVTESSSQKSTTAKPAQKGLVTE
jgi:DNA-binding Xre family transcriptional regulator